MVVHHVNIGLYSCAPENRWLYGPPGANAQISIWNIEQKSRGIIEHSLLLKSGAVCITKINIINKPNSYPLPNITRKLSQNFKAKTLSSFASVRAVKPLCLPVSDHQLSTILSCDVRYIGWFVGNFLFFLKNDNWLDCPLKFSFPSRQLRLAPGRFAAITIKLCNSAITLRNVKSGGKVKLVGQTFPLRATNSNVLHTIMAFIHRTNRRTESNLNLIMGRW